METEVFFRKKHPQVEIRMNVGYTQTVAEDILAFRSDLRLIGREVAHPNIVVIPLWEEELVLIVPPEEREAARGRKRPSPRSAIPG